LSAEIYNQACFHAQQCAEKVLKAWLRYLGTLPPRTHQLSLLLALLPDEVLADLRIEITLLDRFYIPTRYPDALAGALPTGLPDVTDANEAFAIAKDVLQQAECALGADSGA
jgi:HEPN domain-containing protein